MEPRARVVSWGELLWDLFPDGPRLGGAAANLAYHAAKLGADAWLVSRVGDDELGRRAKEFLEHAGVDVRFVGVDSTRPTGTVRVEIVDSEPRYSIADRAAWDAIALTAELEKLLPEADAFCFGTLAQRTPLGSRELRSALGCVRDDCVRICDLNVRPPHVSAEVIEGAIARASVVKINEREARYLADAFGVDDALDWLLERPGIELVALTRGAEGAVLGRRGEHFADAGVPADPGGDAVGAGDAFTAVLAIELRRGTPLREVLARANRHASRIASARGGMPEISRP